MNLLEESKEGKKSFYIKWIYLDFHPETRLRSVELVKKICGHKRSNNVFVPFRNSDGRLVSLVRVVRLLLLLGLRLRYEIGQCQTEASFGELYAHYYQASAAASASAATPPPS